MGFKRYRLNTRVINDLKKRSTIGIVFYVMIACIILFSDNYYDRNPEFSTLFLSLITGICLIRILHLPVARWTHEKFERINNTVFLCSVILTAMIWGAGFARFLLQNGEPKAQLLMVMCTAGLVSGGVVAFIPDLRLSIIFNFLMLIPALVLMVVNQINLPLAFSVFLFFVYLGFIAKRGNKEYWDALENEYLLEEKSKDLEKMSQVDSLTGLYNRRYFDEAFSSEWYRSIRSSTPISIILCDIDHFKQINDQYGHLAGDEYLREVAQLLKRVFRRKTDVTARYGGEEFVVLMPNEFSENACKLAESIRLMTEVFHMEFKGQTIQATISLGVATQIPNKDEKMEYLISKADKALYQSKEDGRNRVTNSNGYLISSLQSPRSHE